MAKTMEPGAGVEPEPSAALDAFKAALDAFRDTKVLTKGGVAAYAILVIAVLASLFAVMSFFGLVADLLREFLLISAGVIGLGVLAAMFNGYFRVRKAERLAYLEYERAALMADLAKTRTSLVIGFLQTWMGENVDGFNTLVSGKATKFSDFLTNVVTPLVAPLDQIGVFGPNLGDVTSRSGQQAKLDADGDKPA